MTVYGEGGEGRRGRDKNPHADPLPAYRESGKEGRGTTSNIQHSTLNVQRRERAPERGAAKREGGGDSEIQI
jgi:hypothetical protein